MPNRSWQARLQFSNAAGVSDRCTAVGGSFFESVPCGGDAYVLKHIIHDWDDENSVQILRNVRAAINPDGKVLIVEAVVPDDDREHLSKLLDLEMLVAATGRERTEAEYAEAVEPGRLPAYANRCDGRTGSIVEAVAV